MRGKASSASHRSTTGGTFTSGTVNSSERSRSPGALAEFDVTRTHRLFDAIVLDRPRLSAGRPDRFLDPSARKDILKWCEARFGQIPELKPAAA